MHIGLELISVFLKFEFYIPTFLFPKKIYIYMCIARKENSSQNIQQHISSKEGSISVMKGT